GDGVLLEVGAECQAEGCERGEYYRGDDHGVHAKDPVSWGASYEGVIVLTEECYLRMKSAQAGSRWLDFTGF
ncbi:MAG: hypothetical protein ACTIC1_20945, partial [Brevibacterium sp.]